MESMPKLLPNGGDRFFDEKAMYDMVESYSGEHKLVNTLCALPLARELHRGQIRKGRTDVPYIYHPLLMSCHAIAMGYGSDDILATALLHDTCEDCGISADDLPVDEKIKQCVRLLTRTDTCGRGTKEQKKLYYDRILENSDATIVKILDRCQNISGMASGFKRDKTNLYMADTREYVLPFMEQASEKYPELRSFIFVLSYQMESVMSTIQKIL